MNDKNTQSDLKPSDELSRDLKALFCTDIDVPAGRDRAVMDQAGHSLIRLRLKPRRWYWTASAAAAVIAIGAVFMNLANQPVIPAAPIAKTDIDQNGSTNILDAFALARSIKSQQPLQERWDLNGDGTINQQDVDSIAQIAVRLDEGVL